MSHQSIRDLLSSASTSQSAVLAFNVVLLETAEALVAAAEQANRSVVLQISQNCVTYHGSLEPIAAATLALARSAAVPVSVHLDHAEDIDLIDQAVELGFDSVMYDGSRLDDAQNRETTAEVVTRCHAAGVAVEAELGEIGGKDGVHSPTARTDPQQARQFVLDTGVSSLAVAVGSSHAMSTRDAQIDLDLIAAIHAAVEVPMVLHGSSGVSDEQLRGGVRAGMRKINISTHINGIFTEAARWALETDPQLTDPRKYISQGRTAVTAEVNRLLTLLS